MRIARIVWITALCCGSARGTDDPPTSNYGGQVFPKPYSAPCVERENVFEFTEKPKVKMVGQDKYEITFAVKGNCDVTVGIVDGEGKVVRHLGAGVLGSNAPLPFQKNSLKQTLYWNGKDDLDEYHKTPDKLKVRVSLGLKPEFDKRLGWHPKHFPGSLIGLCADQDGVYVLSGSGGGNHRIRAFDHDGNYRRTVFPPAANTPEEKLGGMGFIEYEPGKKALHSPDIRITVSDRGDYLPKNGSLAYNVQPAIYGGKIWYANSADRCPSSVFFLGTDGTLDAAGVFGRPLLDKNYQHVEPRFALSPDGRWLYLSHAGNVNQVYRMATSGPGPATPFFGSAAPGSDDKSLNNGCGIACDGQGRVYVCDLYNNRLQIVSPEGKPLKAIPVKSPHLVQVHPKTEAIYVVHQGSRQGKGTVRVTKFTSFEQPAAEFSADLVERVAEDVLCALDAWTSPPRLWLADGVGKSLMADGRVKIFQETGKDFVLRNDFAAEAEKESGHPNLFTAGKHAKVVCDPVRGHLYYFSRVGVVRFELATGRFLGTVKLPGTTDDIAFDKRGYLHAHFNPGFYLPGVGRVDPDRPSRGHYIFGSFTEVPYDYGEDRKGIRGEEWLGVLPLKDQPGAKFFQDGIGVNMRGDIAVESNIYFAPKFEDEARRDMAAKIGDSERYMDSHLEKTAAFFAEIKRREKMGEETYYIPRRPGWPMAGGTVWTFDRNGELRQESAVVAPRLINGVMIDEDGNLYLSVDRQRIFNGKTFLAGHGGTFGGAHPLHGKGVANPFISTYMKTRPTGAKILVKDSPAPMEPWPTRPPDLGSRYTASGEGWVEGADWLYAGASGIVNVTCSCPSLRAHTDWYKRSFVPEAYRHSFGILDTNGNLLMHLGTYGNADSGYGPQSAVKVGGNEIALSYAPYISGTDEYLAYGDYHDRLIVLRLNYHAEETVGIQ